MRLETSLYLWPDWRIAPPEPEPQEEGIRLTAGPRTYGMSIAEIGQELGISGQAASYRVTQALRKIVRLLANV